MLIILKVRLALSSTKLKSQLKKFPRRLMALRSPLPKEVLLLLIQLRVQLALLMEVLRSSWRSLSSVMKEPLNSSSSIKTSIKKNAWWNFSMNLQTDVQPWKEARLVNSLKTTRSQSLFLLSLEVFALPSSESMPSTLLSSSLEDFALPLLFAMSLSASSIKSKKTHKTGFSGLL